MSRLIITIRPHAPPGAKRDDDDDHHHHHRHIVFFAIKVRGSEFPATVFF